MRDDLRYKSFDYLIIRIREAVKQDHTSHYMPIVDELERRVRVLCDKTDEMRDMLNDIESVMRDD